jgi:hypothetical protein
MRHRPHRDGGGPKTRRTPAILQFLATLAGGPAAGICLTLALLLPLAAPSQTARRATSPGGESKPPSRDSYSGDNACLSCHEAEAKTYAGTAHHLTSQIAGAGSIAGNFNPGSNIFKTSNPSLLFKMTADGDGYHQTAVDQLSPAKSIELTERFDIVVGAGRKSQTYLYWKGDELFELPVSWWAKSGTWINSPGYQDGAVRFDRIIVPRCLECHASYFESTPPPSNRYARDSLTLGITCERCHGPGREHVTLYRSPSPPKPAKAIINPASLARNRQIDACALCHAGLGEPLAPALSFVPGDALDKYLRIPAMDPDLPIDVHGNQVQLLKRSRCFQASNMTCSTCHNVHQQQRDAAAFSRFCLDCHQAKQCGKYATMGEQITGNCIDCHMPLRQSQALFSDSNDQTLQLPVRDHHIAIYPAR